MPDDGIGIEDVEAAYNTGLQEAADSLNEYYENALNNLGSCLS